MKPKNLVFLMTDQQRADTLGMTACGRPVTPHLDRLAAQSAVFRRAYDACPLCVPARTALATGRSPLSNGMMLNDLPGRYARDNPTLHRLLAENGWDVAHIGVAHISVKPPLRHSLPFAAWECDDTYAEAMKHKGISLSRAPEDSVMVEELGDGRYRPHRYSNARVSLWEHPLEDFKDVWFASRAVDFLDRPHPRPFALFLYLWAPHPPLIVPAGYLRRFPYEQIPLPANTDRPCPGEPDGYRRGAAAQLGLHPPEKGWRQAWSAHLALANLCDEQCGRILQALRRNGLEQDTLVVFTTDHGEQLGQHGMYQKMEMYEPAVRVPALFHLPGGPACTLETPISHLDFVPTVTDLLGLPGLPGAEGLSLAPSVRSGCEPLPHDVFGVYCGNHAYGDMRRMIVRANWKYVFDGNGEELYDLDRDPLEMQNLASSRACAGIRAELRLALASYCAERGDPLFRTDGAGAPPFAAPRQPL